MSMKTERTMCEVDGRGGVSGNAGDSGRVGEPTADVGSGTALRALDC